MIFEGQPRSGMSFIYRSAWSGLEIGQARTEFGNQIHAFPMNPNFTQPLSDPDAFHVGYVDKSLLCEPMSLLEH